MSVYEIITDRLIKLLESGHAPWRQTWTTAGILPANLISRRPYRGINVFMLASARYESPYWCTFKQARELGGHVRKGEHGHPVVFWKFPEDDAPADDDGDDGKGRRSGPLLRYYTVFNAAQCELPAGKVPPSSVPANPFTPIDRCEHVLDHLPENRPSVSHGLSQAFYRPSDDSIGMPTPERFETPENYYGVLFHELTHATGHASRLNRKGISEGPFHFGSLTYSQEELVAEMGAAFLCGHCGIDSAPLMENSAAYLRSWIARLKGDSRLAVMAAAQAQKAADWILRTTHEG